MKRKELMNHMFALMEEIKKLVTRLEPRETGHIHTTINVLNDRVEEIRHQLTKSDDDIENLFNMDRDDPHKEGTN
jgi:anion-transporting  ArsA/GET3 family ATPase